MMQRSVAVLLLIAAILYPSLAPAKTRGARARQTWTNPVLLQPNTATRFGPEIALGGTVVLRGSRAPTGNYAAPELGVIGEEYGSSLPFGRLLFRGAGG